MVSAVAVFISCFAVSAFAGLASLLRSGVDIKVSTVLSSILNSGLLGLGISLLWYKHFLDNVYYLIGICVIIGLGGMSTVDFVVDICKRTVGSRIEKDIDK